jgi:branched-chain amino acid transport system permease protein
MTTVLDHDDVLGGLPSSGRRWRSDVVIAAATVGVGAVLLVGGARLDLSTANRATGLFLLMTIGMAWNLVGGFGGQFSLGHSIFIGAGGYTTAVLLDKSAVPTPLVLVAAGGSCALIGVVLAYPMARLRGPYFAIGTLGLALAATGWMLNWRFTRTSEGYPIPVPKLADVQTLYRYATVLVVLSVLTVVTVMRMPLGLRLLALREDEAGAISIGVRRLRTLLAVWAFSAFLTGLAGAALGLQKGLLEPVSAFSLQYTLDAVVVCVIGGLGTLSGPLIGAVVVFALRQYTVDFADWASLIEALVVVLVVRLMPGGVVGLFAGAARRLPAGWLYRGRRLGRGSDPTAGKDRT